MWYPTRNLIFVVLAIAGLVVAALVISEDTPSIETPPTSTPQELAERRVTAFEALPEYDKLRVSEDIGVYYLHCFPAATYDPISTVLISYFPDGSYLSPIPQYDHTNFVTEDGRLALEAVVADDELMEQILDRSPESARCPDEPETLPVQ